MDSRKGSFVSCLLLYPKLQVVPRNIMGINLRRCIGGGGGGASEVTSDEDYFENWIATRYLEPFKIWSVLIIGAFS